MKKKIIIGIVSLLVLGIVLVFGINFYVKLSTKKQIITVAKIGQLKNVDCILILGAGVWGDKPSPMLKDRLDKGIELYKSGVAPKIIMSGDHGREDYDEVNLMKNYAIEEGVPSEDIFMDHAGFSTYDSMYRAKNVFQVKKMVVVSQQFHLYRALYISNALDVEAYGVMAEPTKYSGQFYRELREILARDKDFVKSILKPKSTYVGESIPVSGNGDETNDK